MLFHLNVCIINYQRAQQNDTDPVFTTIQWHFTEIHGHGQTHRKREAPEMLPCMQHAIISPVS